MGDLCIRSLARLARVRIELHRRLGILINGKQGLVEFGGGFGRLLEIRVGHSPGVENPPRGSALLFLEKAVGEDDDAPVAFGGVRVDEDLQQALNRILIA